MANVLDDTPLRACARRASEKIADAKIKARFERLAHLHLLQDARNLREATEIDMEAAPDWARRAWDRGEALHIAKLSRTASARVHMVARQVADTAKLAESDANVAARYQFAIARAREFLDKFDRADFATTFLKTRGFSEMLAVLLADRDDVQVCAPATVNATFDRVWHRVTSLADLRAVGRQFGNCLARMGRASYYGRTFVGGACQFWVLRDSGGKGLIVAMAPAPLASVFLEVRGPRNAPVSLGSADMWRLAVALGMPPPPPPPPPDGIAALMLAARRVRGGDGGSGAPCEIAR